MKKPTYQAKTTSQGNFGRVVDSPLLLLCLVVVTSALGGAWYHKVYAAFSAPAISGYDWSKHPDALLIAVPLSGDCGCGGISIEDRVKQGVKHNLDVVIVASRSHPEVTALRKVRLQQGRLAIIANVNRNVIKRFSSDGKLALARIYKGRIIRHAEGDVPRAFFQ